MLRTLPFRLSGLLWTLVLLLSGPLPHADAQNSFRTRHFEEFQGLSSNFVENILQCADGKLLISTKQGVDIFDGLKFVPLLIDSLPLGYITAIHRNGNTVWLGGFDGRLLRKDSKGTPIEGARGLEGSVRAIHVDANGALWAFSRSGGVLWTLGQDTSVLQLPIEEILVNTVCALPDGRFLIGSAEGLYIAGFNGKDGSVDIQNSPVAGMSRITALAHDPGSDIVWVGTEDEGLIRMELRNGHDAVGKEFRWDPELRTDDVQGLFVDNAGTLWAGMVGIGLCRIEWQNSHGQNVTVRVFDDPALQQHRIHSVFEDDEGTLWVSTFGGGIIQIIPKVFEQPFDENWLRQQRITRLFKDSKGNVWIGIDKGIFQTETGGTAPSYHYHHIGGQRVTSITESSKGQLWVGTASNGIFIKGNGNPEFKQHSLPHGNLSNAINSIVPYGDLMHVCTKEGLYTMDHTGRVQQHVNTLNGLPHNNVTYAHTDRHGNTWIANQGNRVCLMRDGRISFLEENTAQNIVDVHHILEDDRGRLWFSTLGSGIFVLEDGMAHHIGEKQGLPSLYCYQMVQDDDGNVWASHQKSVSQITPMLSVSRVIEHQDLSPVANTMVTFLFKDDKGNIWVTSTHGVVKYNPRIDKESRSIPHLSISAMRVNDVPTDMVPGLILPYRKHSIQFDLSGISLRNPERIRYRYQLLGYSDAWLEEVSASGTIQFPKLEDGEYTLNVIASKNGGEWTPEPVSFSFTVTKPIYRTWPFYILCIIAIMAAVGGFVRYRTVKLMTDKQELEKLVTERTVEIQEQKEEIERSRDEISRYAKDITDSIKYAQRIQAAIFPEWEKNMAFLEESFVFFRSKDIVSGDFFFAEKVGDLRIFAAVDCTGHGVPGGFMSIVANNLLNQAVKQVGLTRPSEILDYLNEGITNTLHQTYEESSVKDGLDIAICTLDLKHRKLQFAGAYNPLYLFRNGELSMYKGDRFPVGVFVGEEMKTFTNVDVPIEQGDVIYLFSDGYADQFGGPRGKKLKLHGFRDLLAEIHQRPMAEQGKLLALKLDEWMGDLEQIDDIVVMGIRIT